MLLDYSIFIATLPIRDICSIRKNVLSPSPTIQAVRADHIQTNLSLEVCLRLCLFLQIFELQYAYKRYAYKKRECIPIISK